MSEADSTYSATHPEPAPITLGRVTRYYELLCELGLADAFDAAKRQRAPAATSGQPSSITDQAPSQDADDADLTLTIDMPRIVRKIAEEGALIELGTILYDVDAQTAERLDVEKVESALYHFGMASHWLIKTLLETAGGSV